jgi:EpsI family protein
LRSPRVTATSRRLAARLYAVSALLAVVLFGVAQLQRVDTDPTALLARLEHVPRQIEDWSTSGEGGWGADAVTALGVDDYLLRRYTREDGAQLWLYIGVHDGLSMAPGSGSPHSPLLCYPGQGWEIVARQEREVARKGNEHVAANWLLVEKDGEAKSVIYWQQWGGEIATEQQWGDYGTKLAWLIRLPGLLTANQRTDRSLVRISSPVMGDIDGTLAHQRDFAAAILPILAEVFQLQLEHDPARPLASAPSP